MKETMCEYYDKTIEQYFFEEMEQDNIRLLDAQEIPVLQSTYIKETVVNDCEAWQLCYGVVIPQRNEDIERLMKKMKFYKFADLSYIKDEYECINSYYQDIMLFPKKIDKFGQIPFACLMKSSIDFSLPKKYHSYTLFLRHSDMSITSNLLNRKFVLSIEQVDSKFKQNDVNNWRKYIDKKIVEK